MSVLELKDPTIVIENPDRPNIFYEIRTRPPSIDQQDHLDVVLNELAQELKAKQGDFPLTILYTDYNIISYCMSYMEYVMGKCNADEMRYHQYHNVATERIKCHVIDELRQEKSYVRLIFATIALGMGMNARNIRRIIHYKPPTNLDRYMQETGRAGRDGEPAHAILYWNNTDVRKNRPGITDSLIDMCKSCKCVRAALLNHLGFDADCNRDKEKCCNICRDSITKDPSTNTNVENT